MSVKRYSRFLHSNRKGGVLMLTKLLQGSASGIKPKEGDLYKEVTVGEKKFRLVYGYYEEDDRNALFNDPIPIYPDLIKNPEHTSDGFLIVTAMQDVCENYNGSPHGDSCNECVYFQKDKELFGMCSCIENRKTPSETSDKQNE